MQADIFANIAADFLADENKFCLEQQPTLESNSNVYFSGYLVSWLERRKVCGSCLNYFDGKSNKKNEVVSEGHKMLTKIRKYDYLKPEQGLKEPTYLLVQVV